MARKFLTFWLLFFLAKLLVLVKRCLHFCESSIPKLVLHANFAKIVRNKLEGMNNTTTNVSQLHCLFTLISLALSKQPMATLF